MNKIYRLKFDKRRNELVVVSEITAGMGKEKSTGHIADLSALSPFRKLLGTLTPLALLIGLIISLFPGMALANPDLPTGGQIVGGQGSISTSGNQMTIHQQTQNMATSWHSFDVGQNNTVQFVQPDSSSVALNRVTGASGSQIMGTLKANGQVFILNPNGVLFGKDARVNVAGLVASTKNLSTADFMKGQYTLGGSGNPGAQVVNQGSLTTSKGGYIVLAGERVSNSGTVTTPGGKTVLAAGKTVTLQLDNGGLASVSVNGSVVNALVENRGLISATNGQVYLTAKGQDMLLNTVVNNSGTIETKGLASRGGEIVLSGGDSGVVSQFGQLLADGLTGQGGKITLEGQNIHLADSSLTSASGKTGGGEVYVGGGWQGQDERIKNASKVVMDQAATVDVSATDAGNGGTAVLWSDDYTNFRGTVLAKGGAQSGNGGRVETSSHRNLQASGEVDASARAGHGGEWLLDPTDVTIVGTGADSNIDSTTSAGIFTPTAGGAKILNTSIQNQLNAGTNVTVKTSGADTDGQSGNITVNANILKNAGPDATLTLLADNNIVTANRISMGATGGKLNLNLLAGNTTDNAAIQLGTFINISLNGGDFLAGPANTANNVSLNYSNNGQIHGGNVTLNVSGGLNGYAYKVQADNDLTINGPVRGRTGWGVPLNFTAGGVITMVSPGSIDLQAAETSNSGGSVVISGDKGVSLQSTGVLTLAAANATTNRISIISRQGDVSVNSGGALDLRQGNISGANVILSGTASGGGAGININNLQISATTAANLSGKADSGNNGLTFNNLTVNSCGTVDISGTSNWGNATQVNWLNVTSAGDVNISGQAPGRAWALGLDINNSNINSTGGNVTLTGLSNSDPNNKSAGNGLNIKNSNITVNNTTGRIVLHGSSSDKTGLWVNNSNLSGNSLSALGVSTKTGLGFAFDGSHLLGGLSDLANVTFSSAGSATGVRNKLDASLIPDNISRDNLLAKHIENITSIDMNGTAIFDDLTKGLVMDATSASTPNGGWILDNTSLNAGGDVILKGFGFTNSSLNITGGGLDIDNPGLTSLTGTSVTADGEVKIHAGSGNINLTNGNLSTKGDIVLTADTGTITLSGANALLNSSSGNISMVSGNSIYITNGAHVQAAGELSVFVNNKYNINNARLFNVINAGLSGSNLNISVNGNVSPYYSLLFLSNSSFCGGDILINATGNGRGAEIYYLNKFKGNLTLSTNSTSTYTGDAPASIFLGGGSRIEVDGNADISSHVNGQGGKGAALSLTGGINVSGDLALTGMSGDDGVGVISVQSNKEIKAEGNITISGGSNGGVGVLITKGKIKGDNVVVKGTSTTGSGVYISDGVALNNAEINGGSDSGIGVLVAGNASLNTASVNGTSASGTGTNINGCLTVSGTSDIKGTSTSGTGLNIDKTVTVAEADRDNITFTGTSTDKAGVILGGSMNGGSVIGTSISVDGIVLADNAVVTDASLKGSSTNGSGVSVTGNISLDDTTAAGLNATSASGAGLSLENYANVSVVNITTVTQEKHDADGNPVIGADGKPVMEIVTTTKPVTTPVILTGTSQNGSGVITSGNVSISGVILNGSATTAEGIGATLGGNLTISDNISGVTVNATGNGTALVVDNVTINANGYTETGKDFVINASTSDSDGTAIKTQGNNQLGDVTLNATASNGGTAVELGGQVSGGQITGTADSGQSVVVSDGTNLDSTDVKGHSGSGTGLNVSGNVSLSNAVLTGTTETGTGTVVSGAVTADEHSEVNGVATADGGTGVSVGGMLTGGSVTGSSTTGDGVVVSHEANLDSSDVKGHSASGTGLNVNGNVSLSNAVLTGTTETGTGSVVSGAVDADEHSEINGVATADGGTGVSVGGVLNGGSVNGSSTTGDAVHVTDGSQINGADIQGTSQDGSAIRTEGQVSVSNSQLSGHSVNGADLEVFGTLSHDVDTKIDAETVVGHENIQEVKPDTPLPPEEEGGSDKPAEDNPSAPSEADNDESFSKLAEINSLRQGAVNAQVTHMNQPEQDGFHSAATPPVSVDGYRPAAQTVDIRLCDGNACQLVVLDAAKPTDEKSALSDR
ncbi:hypothetical protein DQC61_26670 [Salmonella enterica subsp. enterica serovar Muenchen]|nr:hypothetical protein [Salmonella enterica subsp. enterica serovar Muenchen]